MIDSVSPYFQLQGQALNSTSLSSLCLRRLKEPDLEEWELRLYSFILEWLNEEDFVTVHTSGSTGPARPVKIKKKHMVNSAKMTIESLGLERGARALLCLGAEFIAGKMMIVRAMIGGFNLLPVPAGGNPLKYIEDRIDFTAMVPLQLFNSLHDEHSLDKLKNIQHLIIGGAAISPSLEAIIRDLPGNIYATFGMTETVTHIALRRVNGLAASDYFALLPGIEAWAADNGCMAINAPGLAEETILTNDLVEFSDDTHFRVLGRLDDIINSGGMKLIPEEIEKKIQQLFPDRIIISSLPDEKFNEKLVLVVETSNESKYMEAVTLNKIRAYLDPFEQPKKVILLDHFPETESLKIKRKEIRERVKAINQDKRS